MMLLILIVAITIIIRFQCALYEGVFLSTRRGTLEAAKASGSREKLATQFIEMKKEISATIASILILTVVADIAGSTVAGIFAGEALGPSMLPLFSVVLTLIILFFGEIVPKTVGVVYWRILWPFIVWPLMIMQYILYPIVVLTNQFSNLLTRGYRAPGITEEEILASVRLGALEGQITPDESLLVHNIVHLEDKKIEEIMTPRMVVFSLNSETRVSEAVKEVDKKGFTRIPIYERDRENVTGYVMIQDLFSAQTLNNPELPIKHLAKPISFVPETNDSLSLLTNFLKHRRHIAMVVDEYGGIAGLVTLEDLIETLLGKEIVDETDMVVDLQQRAREMKPQRPTI
jgi:CBS domain containing-hemolysin-like protein